MMRHLPALFTSALLLAGCSAAWIGEDRAYAMKKDFHDFTSMQWTGTAVENSGIGEVLPSPRQKEAKKEQDICLHANAANRVTMQDGVSDAYTYRRCPLAPYDNNGGTRMGIRPDGQGTVLKGAN